MYGVIRFLFTIIQNLYHIPSYLFFTWFLFLPVYYLRPNLYKRIENLLYNCCLYTVGSWSWLANIQGQFSNHSFVIMCGVILCSLSSY